MLFSYSLIKRYTPPTCTLEIWGNASPLSFLMNRHWLEDIKFELHFDDPKTLEEEQMTLKGDRNDLQTLCDIVTLYVENLLTTAPSSLPLQRLSTFAPSSLVSVIETPPLTPETASLPSLKPISLLSHQLSLGSLAPNEIETEINLSVSQLFDLANVLEEYSLEAEILPTLKPETSPRKKLLWGMSAAACLVALTFAGITAKNYYLSPKPVALKPSNPQKENQSTIQDILPPVPLPPGNFSIPSPTTPPTLEQREKLSSSGKAEAGKTPPRNPSVVTVIPPTAIIPPPPVVPPAPEKTTIVLTPNPSNIPAPPNLPSSPQTNQLTVPQRGNSVPTLSDSVIPPLSQIGKPSLSPLPPLSPSESTLPPPSLPSTQNSPVPQPSAALLDIIPQVTEAREYFQQRWQPPENLKQTLEYRLQLNSDGSLARITPLGRAAAIYLDRTNMPLLGEPFVSPPPESLKNPQIRLVLSPDKRVKTFLEEQ